MKWVIEIENALETLGGIAELKQIYNFIGMNSKRTTLPESYDAIIRGTLEMNSSDSKKFTGKRDVFYSVEGLGKGIWGLRKSLKTLIPEDIGDIEEKTKFPDKTKVEIYRVLRDTQLTKKLKLLYKNKCQICGLTINLKTNKYSEAHHIKPIGKHSGPDSLDNIIVLCPNHHVEFDYGVIAIDPNTYKIMHKDQTNTFLGKKMGIHPKHILKKEFLIYHLEKIFNPQIN